MILYGSPNSPFVRHCRIVCETTGSDWSFEEITPAQSQPLTPTLRVPCLKDGDITLTDSTSIIKHVRDKHSQAFIPNINSFDLYCMVNTALDTSINLYLLSMEGLTPENSKYLKRQQTRIENILALLEQKEWASETEKSASDELIRLACYVQWSDFREQMSLQKYPNLAQLVEDFNQWQPFASTQPGNS